MSEPCTKERELGMINTNLDHILKEFDGHNGIPQRVARIELQVGNITKNVDAQATSISMLIDTLNRTTAVDGYKTRRSEISWKVAGIIISSILSLGGIASSIIIKFIN